MTRKKLFGKRIVALMTTFAILVSLVAMLSGIPESFKFNLGIIQSVVRFCGKQLSPKRFLLSLNYR